MREEVSAPTESVVSEAFEAESVADGSVPGATTSIEDVTSTETETSLTTDKLVSGEQSGISPIVWILVAVGVVLVAVIVLLIVFKDKIFTKNL